jgi:outer membrane receptor protein involved in Fe transport
MTPRVSSSRVLSFRAVATTAITLAAVCQGQVAPSAATSTTPASAREDAVTLSAFEVKADAADSYEALNTSGVTGTNRSIRSLPMTMNVYTRTFIDELNAVDISDILSFTPNVSYSLDGVGGGTQSPEQFRLRGLTSKEERRRNGFVSLSRSDVFSTERLEVLRGAQALLYGQGVSSGAVNTVTKRSTQGSSASSACRPTARAATASSSTPTPPPVPTACAPSPSPASSTTGRTT